MIKDFFVSFKDNFKEKTRNPFLGTYVLVWLVRNWEIVFTIFNFDSDQKLDAKVSFIKKYYETRDFFYDLLENIAWSFGILIFTYILLNISSFIVNLFEKRLSPWIHKITDSKSIVLKSSYDNIRSERDELQNRLDLERESKLKLERRIKTLDEEILALINEPISDINNQSNSNKSKELSSNLQENELIILMDKLNNNYLKRTFIEKAIEIKNGDDFPANSESLHPLIEFGLVEHKSTDNYGNKKYNLTQDGELLFRKIRFK